MKNRLSAIRRVLIVLYVLIGALTTVLLSMAAFGGMQIQFANRAIALADGFWPRVAVGFVCLVMLLWAAAIIWIAVSRMGSRDRTSVSISNTENGDVRISMQAMDSLVKRAIGDMDGIANIKTNVLNNDDSISVEVSMALESDVHIPNTTMLLQRTVKNFIEEYSGIAVRDVTVIVTSVADPIVVPKQLAIETLPKKAAKVDGELKSDDSAEYSAPVVLTEEYDADKAEAGSENEAPVQPDAGTVSDVEPEESTDSEITAEAEMQQEPETEVSPNGDSFVESDDKPEDSSDKFVISDSLPDLNEDAGMADNIDYNFSQPVESNDGDDYYSPYQAPNGNGGDKQS